LQSQIELLIATVCVDSNDTESCEDAFNYYWGPVTTALYGPENQETIVHELCHLAGVCGPHQGVKAVSNDYVSKSNTAFQRQILNENIDQKFPFCVLH
jgi:hypothetical protein